VVARRDKYSYIKYIRDFYTGINEYKKSYQPRSESPNNDNGGLLADSHSNLNRWKNYFCHLFNVHGVKDIQTDINARS
jgi:hypothetical protein